jgi:hypothetical protein
MMALCKETVNHGQNTGKKKSEHIITVFQQYNTLRKHKDNKKNEQYKYPSCFKFDSIKVKTRENFQSV